MTGIIQSAKLTFVYNTDESINYSGMGHKYPVHSTNRAYIRAQYKLSNRA